jgi:hypothetical protein
VFRGYLLLIIIASSSADLTDPATLVPPFPTGRGLIRKSALKHIATHRSTTSSASKISKSFVTVFVLGMLGKVLSSYREV